MQAFKTINKGFSQLADESEDFDSKTILGLLRNAPDLLPNIKNVQSMYEPTEEKGMRFAPPPLPFRSLLHTSEANELVPQKGKDERYDEIVAEIEELEEVLEDHLKKFQKSLG